jgi:hypothetical protein
MQARTVLRQLQKHIGPLSQPLLSALRYKGTLALYPSKGELTIMPSAST